MSGELDDDWRRWDKAICEFFIGPTPASLAAVKALLHPDNILGTGCEVERHPDCCLLCRENQRCENLPMHPNCFPAGTVVSGPKAVASVTRWYSGELVEIQTRSGAILSCTPNHPVLTGEGWISAGLLDKGCYVVRESGAQGRVVGDPDDYQQPALIEEVAGTVGEPGSVAATRVKVAAVDFHGDGVDGDVAVVRADGLLLLDPADSTRSELGDEFHLEDADIRGFAFPNQGSLLKRFERVALAASRAVCRLRPGHSLLRSAASLHEPVSGSATSIVREVSDTVGYPVTSDSVGPREGLDGLTGAVTLDQVVKVRRHPFAGHVFNLETRLGYYLANSIVVHNCRCRRKGTLTAPEFGGTLGAEPSASMKSSRIKMPGN